MSNRPVYLITARDQIVRHLADPVARSRLRERLVTEGLWPAYTQAIAEAKVTIPASYYVDLVPMIRAALRAQVQPMVRRVSRRGMAA